MHGWAIAFDIAQHEKIKAFHLVTRPGRSAQKLQAGRHTGLALKAANRDTFSQAFPAVVGMQGGDDALKRHAVKGISARR